jgi:hypothetical protein
MPEDLCVPSLSTEIPEWNRTGDSYTSVFKFASRYLDYDGGLILFMPIGVLDSQGFVKILEMFGFQISIDWLFHQPAPLAHSNYSSKEVKISHSYIFPSL